MSHALRLCAAVLVVGTVCAAPAMADPASDSPEPEGYLAEPGIITRAVDFVTRMGGEGVEAKNGLYPASGDMPSGSGWISLGPGYRHWLFGDAAVFDSSAAISWRAFKTAQASLEFPHLAGDRLLVGGEARWQDLTQLSFFGYGPNSSVGDESEYRLKSTNVVGFASVRLNDRLSTVYRGGWLGALSVRTPAGSFKKDVPASIDRFPGDPSFVEDQPDFLYGEAALVYDTRDYRSHPANGSYARVGWTVFDDRDASLFAFQRLEAEAMHFMALGTPRIVLAAHGWVADSHPNDGNVVPAYLQPTLGSANTLRGYDNYRFHDNDLLVVNLETRFAIFAHVDAVLFGDAGNVAPTAGDLNLDHTSYGAGLRIHTRRVNFGRLDVARGSEGWQVLARWSDPFHFSRMTQRFAPAPFDP